MKPFCKVWLLASLTILVGAQIGTARADVPLVVADMHDLLEQRSKDALKAWEDYHHEQVLASHMPRPPDAKAAGAVSDVSFIEQRNLILFEGVAFRRDWVTWAQRHIAAADLDFGALPPPVAKVFELYFMWLQASDQIDRNETRTLATRVHHAELRFLAAESDFRFSEATLQALDQGVSEDFVMSVRSEVHGPEPLSPPGGVRQVLVSDVERDRAARDQAQKSLDLARKTQGILENDIHQTQLLLAQMQSRIHLFPQRIQDLAQRPLAYPLINRTGHHYTPADWASLQEQQMKDLEKLKRGAGQAFSKPLASLCGRILARPPEPRDPSTTP